MATPIACRTLELLDVIAGPGVTGRMWGGSHSGEGGAAACVSDQFRGDDSRTRLRKRGLW